ncbi:hypothetical protein [Bergeriella denitrificans]|nr:hypothetical protein [Bergeriella denitrificans]
MAVSAKSVCCWAVWSRRILLWGVMKTADSMQSLNNQIRQVTDSAGEV